MHRQRSRVGNTIRIAAILACALLALALAATPALAKKKHKKHKAAGNPLVTVTATGNTASNPGVISTATATCPTGTVVLGGGFSAPFNGSVQLVVVSSYRSSPTAWTVSAVNGAGAGAATAYAYCRKNSHPITDVTAAGTLASGIGQNNFVVAECPPGTVVINGGFETTVGPGPTQFAFPQESIGGGPTPGAPLPAGYWDVSALNNAAGAQTVTAHVYCMSGIALPSLRQDQGSITAPVLASLTERSTPFCPTTPKPRKRKGKKKKRRPTPYVAVLSSGAFYSPITGPPQIAVHTDSRIDAGAFIDTVVNGGSGPGTITTQSQAFCF